MNRKSRYLIFLENWKVKTREPKKIYNELTFSNTKYESVGRMISKVMLFCYMFGLNPCNLVKGITRNWVFAGKKSCLLIFSENKYSGCSYEDNVLFFMCIGQELDDAETLNFNDLAIKISKEVEILRFSFICHDGV